MPRPRIDITGKRFGNQTTIECSTRKRGSRTVSYLKLLCDCGTISEKKREKPGKMCAECAKKLTAQQREGANKNAVGRREGSLTVLAREGTVSTHVRYTVRCDCGAIYKTRAEKFTGRTMCWDCHMKRLSPQMDTEKGTNTHPLATTWRGMVRRCYDKTRDPHNCYGAIGITVCDRWRGKRAQGQKWSSIDGFHNFLADMGEKPSETHSIDRIDPYGNYEPSNCRWATPLEQAHNKRAP